MYSSTRNPQLVWVTGKSSASITPRWELTAVVATAEASRLSFVIPPRIHPVCRRRITPGIARRKACPLRIYRWATSDRNATKRTAIRTMLQRTVTFQGVSYVCVFSFCVRDSKVESSVMSTTDDDLWKYSRFNQRVCVWGGGGVMETIVIDDYWK
jgi:hypothetical protein